MNNKCKVEDEIANEIANEIVNELENIYGIEECKYQIVNYITIKKIKETRLYYRNKRRYRFINYSLLLRNN